MNEPRRGAARAPVREGGSVAVCACLPLGTSCSRPALPSPTSAPLIYAMGGPAPHWSPAGQPLCPQADSQRPPLGRKGPSLAGGEVTRRGPVLTKAEAPQPALLAAASLSSALA